MGASVVVELQVLVQCQVHPDTLLIDGPVHPFHLADGLGMVPPGPDVLDTVPDAPSLEGTHPPPPDRHEHCTIVRQDLEGAPKASGRSPDHLQDHLGGGPLTLHAGHEEPAGIVDHVQSIASLAIPDIGAFEVQLPQLVGSLPGPGAVVFPPLCLGTHQSLAVEEAVHGHVGDPDPLSMEEDCDLQGSHPGPSEAEDTGGELGRDHGAGVSGSCGPGTEALASLEGKGSAPPVDGGAGHTEDGGSSGHRLLMGIVDDTFSVSHWGDHV